MCEIMPQLEALKATESALRHVFVYGTLRRGEQRDINRLNPAPLWVGLGYVSGILYDLGDYPGLVTGACGEVLGEIYLISAALERLLDEIEEVWPQETGEYKRRQVIVRLQNALPDAAVHEVECLLYEINPSRTDGQLIITSGDWVSHRQSLPGNKFSHSI
jgi:gamma-glutamylcyclotransferase (GGCT)/AIG2-like uncharacterized protein YtfP